MRQGQLSAGKVGVSPGHPECFPDEMSEMSPAVLRVGSEEPGGPAFLAGGTALHRLGGVKTCRAGKPRLVPPGSGAPESER